MGVYHHESCNNCIERCFQEEKRVSIKSGENSNIARM